MIKKRPKGRPKGSKGKPSEIYSVKGYYSEDKYSVIFNLIKLCNLRPVNGWREWTDYMGQTLKIYKNKYINIISKDIPKSEIKILDIYQKRHPKDNLEFSKSALFLFDTNLCYIFALGIDDKLRLMTFKDGNWVFNFPILKFDFNYLVKVIKFFIENDWRWFPPNPIKNPIPATISNKLFFQLPLSEDNINKIKELNPNLAESLK